MASHFESLVEMQERSCRHFAAQPLFGTVTAEGVDWMTYAEFGRRVDALRGGLASLGVAKGDRVAVISNNRVEWAVAAFATFGLGAQYVPMYEAQHPDEWVHILHDSGAKVVFCGTPEVERALAGLPARPASLQHVVGFAERYGELLGEGVRRPVPSLQPNREDVTVLLYTSGTTGHPKGVMLSHGNLVSNVNAVNRCFAITRSDSSCSILPWAHAFGQTVELYCLMSMGGAIGIARSSKTLVEDCQRVRPTVLFLVPKILLRIYEGVRGRVADSNVATRVAFQRAMTLAARRRELAARGERSLRLEAQTAVLQRLLFKPLLERFGGRLRWCISGGAPLSLDVAQFVEDIGITIFEGYGLTETSPIVTANTPDRKRLGTIGRPIPGVDVYICDEAQRVLPIETEGELVVVGPNVMVGYHGRPEETAAVIFELDEMRAFRTGDLGLRTADGFIRLVGRSKEQYKLANGKFVIPTAIEGRLELSPFIEQAFVWGDGQDYNVCLLVPAELPLRDWAARRGIRAEGPDLHAEPQVRALFDREVEAATRELRSFEQPRRWALLDEPFSPHNGLLTPKLSLKRARVEGRYRDQLQALYR